MISAVTGAKSQPLRECPAAISSPSPSGPIMGHPSGLIGRMPAQARSVALNAPPNARWAVCTTSARLPTSLVVREESLTLYGFADDDERVVFELLQTASGVGPRLAQAMLAVHSPDALRAHP